jgi:membrane protease YdiL (CAAX protease family)
MSATTLVTAQRQSASPRWTVVATIGVVIGAIVAAALFAWTNSRYAAWITGVIDGDSQLVDGLLFSAFPLVLALGVALWQPRLFGLQLGDSLIRWRRVLGVTVALSALAAIALSQMTSNPFSGADLVIEGIAVPISEELLFRGVLFTLVLLALTRLHHAGRATLLAVLISGVAFGLAHLNNLGSYDTIFVLLQATYATVLGLAAGYLRAGTRSVYPAIVLHAVVNLVAVFM